MSEYQKPQVPYVGYSDLHFATERQIKSLFALGNYDRGELIVEPGRIAFRGMNVQVDCSNISAIALIRKTFPWGLAIAVGSVAAAYFYLNSPFPFTWAQPAIYIAAAILLIGCVRQWREQWVEVVYADSGRERRAYFRREPVFWGSGAARTRLLYQELKAQVLGRGSA